MRRKAAPDWDQLIDAVRDASFTCGEYDKSDLPVATELREYRKLLRASLAARHRLRQAIERAVGERHDVHDETDD